MKLVSCRVHGPSLRPPPLATMSEYRRPSPVGAMALGGGVTVVALLPVFLTGAMAVQITTDLAFGSAGLGLAVAAYRAGGALTSVFLGRLADDMGAIRSIRVAGVIAAVAAIGIATTVTRLATLVAWLALGGAALAMAQPGANRLLINVVDPKRLGFAFGVKQSAPPVASMVAGISVPVIALTVGWRWAFGMAAVAALSLVFTTTAPPSKPSSTEAAEQAPKARLQNRPVILLLAVAFGLGTSTSSAVTTFYVDAASASGSTSQFAGTMLAVASITAIGSRLLSGLISDRIFGGHLLLCSGLLLTGAAGIALLSSGTQRFMAIGVTIAMIGCWGFNGVFWYALVRSQPSMPGRITGAVSPGGLLGSMAGPLVFGVLAERAGYVTAWRLVAVIAVVAAAAMWLGNRKLERTAPADPAT